MEVKIDKRFDLPVSLDQAWALLQDVRATATCMPGAEITEQLDSNHFNGKVHSRIGPAVMTFAGQIEVLELDGQSHTLVMLGKGGDTSGSFATMNLRDTSGSFATMNLRAKLHLGESSQASILEGSAIITVSGRLAQFGSRLLLPVAEAMLKTFISNFSSKASSSAVVQDTSSASSGPATTSDLNILDVVFQVISQWWSRLWRK
jgi:carbon monoxide dehydrogenase subunit G